MGEALPDIEDLKIKAHRYSTTPEVVEAIRISKDNIKWVANWCGGTVNENHLDHQRMYLTVGQGFYVSDVHSYIGDWVIKLKDGLFTSMSDADFSRKYHRTGLRLG